MTPRQPVGEVTRESGALATGRVASPDLPRWRRVLRVAWPVVATNALQSIALSVDLAFVGVLGPGALAAAGVATQVFFLAMAVAAGFAAAALARVARAFGAGDRAAASRSAVGAVGLALAASAPLALALFAGSGPLLAALGARGPVLEDATFFLRVLSFGLPGQFALTTATGAFQGAGDTRPALLVNVGVNVVNLALGWLLIFGNLGAPELGLAGAAIATAISFGAGGAFFLVVLARGRRPVGPAPLVASARAEAGALARLGAPAAAEQLLLALGFTLYLVLILRFGEDALAAHQIGLRVQSFAFMPGFGFSAAAGALVGQGLGRGAPEEAARDGWAATWASLVVMVAMSLVMLLAADALAGVFTQDPEARALGAAWVRALVVAMPAIAFHFTVSGALRGAGDTRFPLLVSFAGLFLLRLPIAYALAIPLGWGMAGVWAAYVVEYYLRAVATTLRFAKGGWRTARA